MRPIKVDSNVSSSFSIKYIYDCRVDIIAFYVLFELFNRILFIYANGLNSSVLNSIITRVCLEANVCS